MSAQNEFGCKSERYFHDLFADKNLAGDRRGSYTLVYVFLAVREVY